MSKSTCLPVFCVDAFTKTAFSGNPAAVCLVSATSTNLTETLMQKIAAEMNLSETAFVFSEGNEDSFKKNCRFGLRWFTPKTEVNLCGHATLGSAAVLFNKIGNESQEISFDTLSGILTTRRQDKLISMDFPLNPSEEQDRSEMENLLKVVVDPSLIQDLEYSPTTKKLVVRLSDSVTRSELESLQPQIPRMVESERTGKVRGVIITLRGSQSNGAVDAEGRGYDFVSRYFAPWVGIPEDPVTGSAHTVLASYWSKQLDKHELYARQCSPRGGDIHLRVAGERVHLAGDAAIIMTGTLEI
ncbi:phenazine biosynthesis-like domain-containing protein 1 [Haliotis rufescens]|uniref:phenazine biosynthesis-like domain-containing protein 1 n=1 Tax=Haliotis rufescens TaxID=6454 RepID=UPI00201EC652|nr:phenazine biosynthesis-like domain-containing protein 1 [Haliotis rufescens]